MTHLLFRFRPTILAIAVLAGFSRVVVAQEVASSPINDLLKRARDAINDLQYARADTVARQLIDRASLLRRSQLALAWQVLAAANYPEEGTRDTVTARRALREAIQRDLDAALPIDLRWSGLDALYAAEKLTTFGMAPRVPATEVMYGGTGGDVVIRVATTFPANSWLLARPQGGDTEITLDSATNTMDATLRIRALSGTTPLLPTGAYEFVVRSREPKSGLSIERTIQASVKAAPLELSAVPPPFDTTTRRPEIRPANRQRGITLGVLFAGMTIGIGKALRAAEPVKSAGADNRAITVGLLMAIGSGVAVWFERGVALDANKQWNATALRNAELRINDANAENAKRAAGYRATILLSLEDK